jgi:guanosine-3',5'-bis(diphosphate) 3'-pyrophosphohydrolase
MERMAARDRTADGATPEFVRDSALLARAYEFASKAHASQRKRGSDAPYIWHPVTVAELLDEEDLPEELLAAALLHDVVESSEVGSAEVEEHFGAGVARLVATLSEDPGITDYGERKRALRDQVEEGGERAAVIYAADKLANVRDMREGHDLDPDAARERYEVSLDVRLRLWHDDLEMVERVAPKVPFLRPLRYELEALEESVGQPRA